MSNPIIPDRRAEGRATPERRAQVRDVFVEFRDVHKAYGVKQVLRGVNLKVYRGELSAAWQEARYGKLWEQGVEGITRYNQINKVEPMQRALDELEAKGWIVGLRRSQSSTRKKLDVLGIQNGFLKVHPIVDWNDKKVFDYMFEYDLPYHPLWEQGYISIGDTHTSHRLVDGVTEEEVRFFGLKRECGLHEDFTDGAKK